MIPRLLMAGKRSFSRILEQVSRVWTVQEQLVSVSGVVCSDTMRCVVFIVALVGTH